MGKTIAITGASGFIGSHLLHLLLQKNYKIKVLLLENDSLKNPFKAHTKLKKHHHIEIIKGDIKNQKDTDKLVKDCQVVFHLAALSSLWLPQKNDYFYVNVEGTRNICNSSSKFGVEKLIYTSSSETIFNQGSLSNESKVLPENKARGPYSLSKIRAEKLIFNYAKKNWACIVHPTLPIGPGDHLPTPVGEMIQIFLKTNQSFYYETGFNFVDVRDVALGHLLAMEKGRCGERYILGGSNLSMKNFLKKLEQISGKPMPQKTIPYFVSYVATCAMEMWSKISKKPPLSSLEGLKSVKEPFYMDLRKSKSELKYRPQKIDEALKMAVSYFKVL